MASFYFSAMYKKTFIPVRVAICFNYKECKLTILHIVLCVYIYGANQE